MAQNNIQNNIQNQVQNNIQNKFYTGIKWNAILFAICKITSIICTILLFKKLTTEDFSLWANIFSAIYLTLLWLDFGFRKSLPLYCPIFAKNEKTLKKFLKNIILFQSTILLIVSIIFIIFSKYITGKLQLVGKIEILYFGCALFFTEGLIAIFKLIYHSYFRQKQFNSFMSIIVIFKSIILFYLVLSIDKSYDLLKFTFILELLASTFSILICTKLLKTLYSKSQSEIQEPEIQVPETHEPEVHEKKQKNLTTEFVFHSGIMWINNNLKSLSERNFTTIFFTYLLGPAQANLFKITNDSAILLQRIVVKTIGTTDTSLLSYTNLAQIEMSQKNREKNITESGENNLMQKAFENLITQICKICIPLFGVILFVAINFKKLLCDTSMCIPGLYNAGSPNTGSFCISIFFLIITFYLFESILSPYERLLEIKRRYAILTLSYLPYIITIVALAFFKFAFFKFAGTSFSGFLNGVFTTILFIHIGRILIYLIMAISVRKKYKFCFPVMRVAKIAFFTFIGFGLASFMAIIFKI